MKYIVSFIVAVVVQYLYAVQHPVSGSAMSAWVDAVGGVVMLTLPASMVCRLFTEKVKGLKARAIDLSVLFGVVGLWWAISLVVRGDLPRFQWPAAVWLRLTLTSWAILLLPFGASVAFFEWLDSRRGKGPNQLAEPTHEAGG
jgi:hypothetical protein